MTTTAKPEEIKALVLDVDGTLTDGRIGYCCGSTDSIKLFYCKDGLGITLLQSMGYQVGVLTGRGDKANRQRCADLHITAIVEGCGDKAEGMLKVCEMMHVQPHECLYMGDDVNDLPAIRMAGLSAAPSDAVEEVKAAVNWVMKAQGGRGAVREAIETLLKKCNKWEETLARYKGGVC